MGDKNEVKRRIINIWKPQLKAVSLLWLGLGLLVVGAAVGVVVYRTQIVYDGEVVGVEKVIPPYWLQYITRVDTIRMGGWMGDAWDDWHVYITATGEKGQYFNLFNSIGCLCHIELPPFTPPIHCINNHYFAGTHHFYLHMIMPEARVPAFFWLVVNGEIYIEMMPSEREGAFLAGDNWTAVNVMAGVMFTAPVYTLHIAGELSCPAGEPGWAMGMTLYQLFPRKNMDALKAAA